MRRGTTPLHIFTLDVPTESIAKLRINYAQDRKVILTKTEADCDLSGNTAQVMLTQEETLSFSEKYGVEIEIHVLTTDGNSLRSEIIYDVVLRCLSEEVLA